MLLITIRADLSTGTLHMETEGRPKLETEDVEWQFLGVPNNYFPTIEFEYAEPDDTPRGPFANLRLTTNQVFGLGRSGSVQGRYKAALVPTSRSGGELEGSKIISEVFELDVVAHEPNSAPVVTVRPQGTHGLEVSPDPVVVCAGDSPVWLFEDFAEQGWSPRIIFQEPAAGAGLWPFGPFTSLMVGSRTIVASGNTHVTGDYVYGVAIIDDATGTILRKGDPVVGNNGDPPGGS
ncbi:MAG: hypothetical protein AAGD38_08420 [Acidobacteriota bacterium]